MQKHKENLFLNKFSLLNSQEQPEDIIWSLSECSDYEEPAANKINNLTNRSRILKRKRKKKVHKNISNLTITVLDTPKHKEVEKTTSPILLNKKQNISQSNLALQIQRHSPVLPSRTVHPKSPILTLKGNSPKYACTVRKKLFSHQESANELSNYNVFSRVTVKSEIDSDYDIDNDQLTCFNPELIHVKEESNARSKLLTKVKSFFDSHFSSQSTISSESISEIASQKNDTKTGSDIELTSCKSQTQSNNSVNSKLEQPESSLGDSLHTFNKSNRYKKNGLSYRLNNLLRRQNTCVSLWQNERYLAANSNFVIPKEENTAFRIKKVNFQYGCYSLEVLNVKGDEYLVIINSFYVSNTIIAETIIKIYEPFKIVQYREVKMLINVCKFECSEYVG